MVEIVVRDRVGIGDTLSFSTAWLGLPQDFFSKRDPVASKNIDSIRRILVIQFRPFGDVLLATSYLESLTERFPQCQIDYLVSEPYEVVVEGHPAITTIIVSPQKGSFRYYWGRTTVIFRVLCTPYDLIIDQADAVGARTIMALTRARFRLGWEKGKSEKFINLRAPLPDKTRFRYAASRNWDMVLPLGIKERAFRMYYSIKEQSNNYIDQWCKKNRIEAGKIILIAPGSASHTKRWHHHNFL